MKDKPLSFAVRATLLALLFLIAAPSGDAKGKWFLGEYGNFRIQSSVGKAKTRAIVKELDTVQKTLARVFPNLVHEDREPITVVLARNKREMNKLITRPGRPARNLAGLFIRTPAGPTIIIDAGTPFEYTRNTVYHEYIHFLTEDRSYPLPVWIAEGMATTFASIQTRSEAKKTETGEAYDMVWAQVGAAYPKALRRLAKLKLLPMEELFQLSVYSGDYHSGNRKDQETIYLQSWATVHYLMFAKHGFPKNSFPKLARVASEKRHISETDFIEITGIGFDAFEERLKNYHDTPYRDPQRYVIKQTRSELKIDLARASDGEVAYLRGLIALGLKGADAAAPELQRASIQLPDSPLGAAALGFLAHSRIRLSEARSHFEEAIARGSRDPAVYLLYAYATIRTENPTRNLELRLYEKTQYEDLLQTVTTARSLGDTHPNLYHYYGEIVIGSRSAPEASHFDFLKEGIKKHPKDARIALYAAILLARADRASEAQQLLQRTLEIPKIERYLRKALEAYAAKTHATP